MNIIKDKYEGTKIKENFRYGILFHFAIKPSERSRGWLQDKLGVSWSNREHFTKQEWKEFYEKGVKVFDEGERLREELKNE